MENNSWSLLSRLRRAVKKVKVLLSLDLNRWRLATAMMIGGVSRRKQLSFNDRPGLRACCEVEDDESEGSSSFSSSGGLRRTTSYPSEDDIDKRAEMFITNFRKQLQIERQISLELKYYQHGDSFKSNGSSFKLIQSP